MEEKIDYGMRALENQAKKYPDCKFCQELLEKKQTHSPRHEAGSCCRSGGHPHCTCDSCF